MSALGGEFNRSTQHLLILPHPAAIPREISSRSYLNKVAKRLNQRPRETLGFETPADRLRVVLQWPVETTVISGHMQCERARPLYPNSDHCAGTLSQLRGHLSFGRITVGLIQSASILPGALTLAVSSRTDQRSGLCPRTPENSSAPARCCRLWRRQGVEACFLFVA